MTKSENNSNAKLDSGFFSLLTKNNVPLFVRIITAVIMLFCIVLTVCLYATVHQQTMASSQVFSFVLNLSGLVILFVLCISFALDSSPTDQSSFWFFILVVSTFFGLFTDATSLLFEGLVDFILLNKIFTFACCLASSFTCFSYCCYQYSLLENKNSKIDKFILLIFVLGILDVLFFIFNIPFGYVYKIDGNGSYIAGNLRALYLLYPTVSLILSMFVSRHILGFKEKKTGMLLMVTVVVLVTASILTDASYSYSFFIFAIVVLLVYGSIQANRGKEIAMKNEMIARQSMDLVKQEQQIMISQINPHFIYNTLSTIECLCETDPQLAVKTVHNFSSYLRTNVDTLTKIETVNFERELEHVGHYVAIEMLRFPQIEVEYDIQDKDFLIPNLTIQPMVENAIRYGVRMRDEGKIKISSYYQDKTHYVEIEDNGCGFDVNAPKKQDGRGHIGIENVKSRLEKMVNGNLCIISKIGVGTKVIISIPAQKESK